MRDFNKKLIKGEWVKFVDDPDIEFLIRPFSLFSLTKLPNEDNVDMTEFWNIFNYIVLQWKGIKINGKEAKCDEENKKIVYDYDQDLVVFAVNAAGEQREKTVTRQEIVNLKKSPDGEQPKQEKSVVRTVKQ